MQDMEQRDVFKSIVAIGLAGGLIGARRAPEVARLAPKNGG
jgi:hypothetical protein